MRSWLFTPATRPERFPNAAAAAADVIIVDLEDSVAPADKPAARETAMDYVPRMSPRAGGAAQSVVCALRINGLDSAAGLEDLLALLSCEADPLFLVVPKVDTAGHVQLLDRHLARAGKRAQLIAQIESAQGLAEVEHIATASPRLAGLMFGTADMAADLGADLTWSALLYARSRLVAAAALRGLLAIDAPFFAIKDMPRLVQETASAVALGFSGKCAVHPSQVAVINAALVPSGSEISNARAVLEENLKGVGVVNGVMVDEAVARRARRVLARARP
ncbi:MAG TPA: aldolase/citrate lyase family protein [Steroidobacteraceae bacterium]|jgi:(S)-citramalyl-CoA lyase